MQVMQAQEVWFFEVSFRAPQGILHRSSRLYGVLCGFQGFGKGRIRFTSPSRQVSIILIGDL